MNINFNDFNFEHLLLLKYPDYDLSELDAIIILKVDFLLKNDIKIITYPILAPYLSSFADKNAVDKSLKKLFVNKVIEISQVDNSCSIDNFKKRLIADITKDYYLEENVITSKNDNFYTQLETIVGKQLKPYERDYVTKWLKEGFLEEDIIQTVKLIIEATNIFNVFTVDKKLKEDKKIEKKDIKTDEKFDSTSWINDD